MNVAFCFSGAIKYPEFALKTMENIFPITNKKVFIHTWKIENKENFLSTLGGIEHKILDEQCTNNFSILEKYNYEKLLIENYETKKEEFQFLYDNLNFLQNTNTEFDFIRKDIGPISMHYSLYKSNELKKEYEKENNMTFDVVFRIRFDSDFRDGKLDISNVKDGIWIPEMSTLDCGGLNDTFAFGSSYCIDVYSSMFLYLNKLQKRVAYHPECMLKEYLVMRGVPVNRIQMYIQINNGQDWRKQYLYYTTPEWIERGFPVINMSQEGIIFKV